MNRNSSVLEIRPQLNLASEAKGHLELYQNNVLRPILKFQNDLIKEYLFSHPQFIPQALKINKEDPKSRLEIVSKFVKSNNGFKNKLYGMITGLMTVDEYQVYLRDVSEYNRRIIGMYIERVV